MWHTNKPLQGALLISICIFLKINSVSIYRRVVCNKYLNIRSHKIVTAFNVHKNLIVQCGMYKKLKHFDITMQKINLVPIQR